MSHSEPKTVRTATSRKAGSGRHATSQEFEVSELKSEIARLQRETSEYLRQAVQDREVERESLARELHDRLGQFLTVMELELQALGRDAGLTPELRTRVLQMRRLTAGAHKELGQLAWEIRPISLEGQGLEDASKRLIEEWSERSTLAFDLHICLNHHKLLPIVTTTLYLVLQEAITNVVRHANATRIGIILQTSQQQVQLVVEDDGKGIANKDSGKNDGSSGRLGLRGIRERLAVVGGSLEIESSSGQGTTLLIHVPI